MGVSDRPDNPRGLQDRVLNPEDVRDGYVSPNPDRAVGNCRDTWYLWVCTRAPGHEGPHAAHGTVKDRQRQYASWSEG